MPMKKHKPVTLFCYEPEGREFESLRAHHSNSFAILLPRTKIVR